MFEFTNKTLDAFSNIGDYWGDKMPIMACEEFAELNVAIIDFIASTNTDDKYNSPVSLKCVSLEVADAIISIFAVAEHFGINYDEIIRIHNYKDIELGSRIINPEDMAALTMYMCNKATINISKTVRKNTLENIEILTNILGNLLGYLFSMCVNYNIYNEVVRIRIEDKLKETKEK